MLSPIRALRIQNNMTQEDLANHLGVSVATISNWERNVYEPDHSNLVQLSKLFNVSVDYLLGSTISHHLKALRELSGHSQKDVAAIIGVSAPAVSDWENGKKAPSLLNLEKLAILYNTTTDALLGINRPNSYEQTDDEILEITQEELDFLYAVRQLTPQQQEHLFAFLSSLIKV